jgi:hypothetical protein
MAATQLRFIEQEHAEPAPLIGRDEMNLAEFPIALLADYAPKGQKTLYFEDGNGKLTITGSDAYGLPTALDADVIVALIYLTKIRNDFKDVKVNFSRYELIKLLNWPDKGSSYTRLDQALNRWAGVLLVYDKCWWNNRSKRYVSAKMHILESVVITEPGKTRAAQGELPLSTFTWNKTFIESCQADNLRQLDLDTYFSLQSAISKRLYRFLGKRFYRQGEWTFDLNEIAFDRVGLSRNYADAGKIKEKLQPALDELEAVGFLRPLSRDERYSRIDRGQWTIQLTRHSPALAAPTPSDPPAAAPEPTLADELARRGVSVKTAAQLVAKHPADIIQQKIDVFDYLVGQKDKRVAHSPEGYLVKSIHDDYKPPKGYTPKAERDRLAEAAKQRQLAEVEKRRSEREQQTRQRAERKAIDAYWESLTSEQQATLQAQADAQADPADLASETGTFKRMGQQIRRQEHIRQLLKNRQPAEA